MRKLAFILALVMLVSMLAVPSFAAEPRATSIVPGITFDGTTAKCTARIAGNNISEAMEATIELYRGETLIETWEAEGNGYIFFSQTKSVTSGYTYKLVVTLTVNGVTYTPVYTTKTLA